MRSDRKFSNPGPPNAQNDDRCVREPVTKRSVTVRCHWLGGSSGFAVIVFEDTTESLAALDLFRGELQDTRLGRFKGRFDHGGFGSHRAGFRLVCKSNAERHVAARLMRTFFKIMDRELADEVGSTPSEPGITGTIWD